MAFGQWPGYHCGREAFDPRAVVPGRRAMGEPMANPAQRRQRPD